MAFEVKADPFLSAIPQRDAVPEALLTLHSRRGTYNGRCRIEHGAGPLVALALRAGRFPPPSEDARVSLSIENHLTHWSWVRDFSGHQTRSRIRFDQTRDAVREDIGGLSIWLKPRLTGGRLNIDIQHLRVFGCPCPKFLLPQSSSVEWQDDEKRFRFDIAARMPVFGLLIRYQGWLTRDHDEQCIG